jgi:hypothetical protein
VLSGEPDGRPKQEGSHISTVTGGRGVPAPRASSGWRRLWGRQLPHYPDAAPRMVYLAITVLATITLYYEPYIQGAVATKIIATTSASPSSCSCW